MLHKAVPKLREALILALLITVVLLASACGGLATPTSPEPGTTPTTSPPGTVPEASSAATPPFSAGQHLRFDRIPTVESLSQATVISILQDNQGFMWFGTEDGLHRYDGFSFAVYKHDPEDPNSLSNSWILSMIKDRSGVLWIGTANGGLNRFDLAANKITRYQHDPDDIRSLSNDRVLSLFEDRVGDLWVGTEFGLNRFVKETESFTWQGGGPCVERLRMVASHCAASVSAAAREQAAGFCQEDQDGHFPCNQSPGKPGITTGYSEDSTPTTTFTSELVDQAALHGVLAKIRDMNLPLISVTPVEPDSKDESQAKSEGGAYAD